MSIAMTSETVAHLLADQPTRATVFERWGIDYTADREQSLAEACGRAGVEPETVLHELDECSSGRSTKTHDDCAELTLSELIDHIEAVHHRYLATALERLRYLVNRVCEAHAETHPELIELKRVFGEFRDEMERHAESEETIIFPLIRKLERARPAPANPRSGSSRRMVSPFRLVKLASEVMDLEHKNAMDGLERMRELTSYYWSPEDACGTCLAMLDALAELETDLKIHTFKEHTILFPRAVRLEAALNPDAAGTAGQTVRPVAGAK